MSSYQGWSILMAGTNGVGKTTIMVEDFIKPYPRDVIVALDDDSETQFDWLDTIHDPKHIMRRPRGKFKIIIPSIGKEEKEIARQFWNNIYTHWTFNGSDYKGGLIYLDDGKAFIDDRPEELARLFKKRRQRKHDIIFCCHGLTEFPLRLYKNLTHVILGRTLDSTATLKTRLNPYLASILCDAVDFVNEMGERDPYYKLVVDLQNPPNIAELRAANGL